MKIKMVPAFVMLLGMLFPFLSYSQIETVISPDSNLRVNLSLKDGIPFYGITYKEKIILEDSPLGFISNEGDFSRGMKYVSHKRDTVKKEYTQDRIKRSSISYHANTMAFTFSNKENKSMSVVFQVSNNDIAFRYELPQWGETYCCVIEKETTGFDFPHFTTTFLSDMMIPMAGFARTSPSYENDYNPDADMGRATNQQQGHVFPALFHVGNNGWALISETGVSSLYCASHLSEGTENGLYTIAYPDPHQNNGFGSTSATLSLPGVTPWRTITVGDNLKPIVETTIPFDVVEPLYEPLQNYQYGRGTWSWILWQDESMNVEDQRTYIDLAAELGYEYVLMDAWWDTRIGYEGMEELVQYAKSKEVDVFLWYNSNGTSNDAPQGPRNKMHTSIARKKEMQWLKKVGVKGLKVDFFGGDKQETMRLYEDILSDANDYGLMIIFHGCTLPRGWERMYPNYIGSEAVIASEMLIFSQECNEKEAFYATLHPFIRNTVGSMEFGGVLLNKRHNRTNDGGTTRHTTNGFQLATAILFQNPVQMFALTPNNLTDVSGFEIDFMKQVPTTWDETLFIDGYPGMYCVLARRHKEKWYVVGVNAGKEPLTLNLSIPMFAGEKVSLLNDDKKGVTYSSEVQIKKKGEFTVTIQPNGGFILTK